jgi:SAM-dependent methyltransferase
MGSGVNVAEIGHEMPDLDSSTDRYALRFAGPAGAYLLQVQTALVLDLVRPWPGARVLDVGGGHAQLAPPLLEAGYDVTVLASCDGALERIRRTVPAVRTAVGDLYAPPFEPMAYDVVVAVRMMAHMREWRRFVAGLCRVARQAVVVDFPTPTGVNAFAPLLFPAKRYLERDTRHFATMGRRAVRREFALNGFHSDAARPQFLLPLVVHRLLNRPAVSRAMESAGDLTLLRPLLGSPVIMRAVRMR